MSTLQQARLYMALARVREAKDAEDVVRMEPRLREVCLVFQL